MKFYKKNKVSIAIFSFFVFINIASFLSSSVRKNETVSLSAVLAKIDGNEVSDVKIYNDSIVATTEKDSSEIVARIPQFYSLDLIKNLKDKKLEFDFFPFDAQRSLFERILSILAGLLSWIPLLFFAWLFLGPMFNRNKDSKGDGLGGGFMGGMNPFNFGRSKAKAIMPKDLKIKFDDVAGIDEAKEDLVEIVDFLKNPMKYQDIGGRVPKGCLLVGQPGTGKTLLAKAIAAEAGVPFFFISGSDFVEMFVGVGASRVRDLFSQAKLQAPCIVFIDEIDAVGRHRGVGVGGGNDEREQTLNQLLVEMDGFQENSGIVVIAATNRSDVLDAALLRPGRFDRQIYVNLPDVNGREKILDVHARKIKVGPDVKLNTIARGTPGFSGADLANVINEAALLAAKRGKNFTTMNDMEDAKDKIMMGAERKSMVMKQDERELTAYHEGGHAILALNLEASDPIHKATIIPRGNALGMVMRLPNDDRFSVTREKMKADMIVAMGGRVAEEMIFGYDKVTSGASSDIKQVTQIAKNMVTKWGLSDKLGNINYTNENNVDDMKISDGTSEIINQEIKKFVDDAYNDAKRILKSKIKDLHLLAKNLLEYETLSGEEIVDLIKNKKDIKVQREEQEKLIQSSIKKNSIFRSQKQTKSSEDIDKKEIKTAKEKKPKSIKKTKKNN